MFYSKSTNGFYSREIHGDAIPTDAVEITAAEHAALLEGQSQGKRIQADEKGFPILKDIVATPEEIKAMEILAAKQYLSETDWYVIRFQETGKLIPEEVSLKREEARNTINS